MMTAGKLLFSADEIGGGGLGRPALSRLGSELALVYHDVVEQPLPRSLQRLVDRLERGSDGVDRSDEDTVTLVR